MDQLAFRMTSAEARDLAEHLATSGPAELRPLGERLCAQLEEIEQLRKVFSDLHSLSRKKKEMRPSL